MEHPKKISTVRYWNYIVSPFVVILVLFGLYTMFSLGNFQRIDNVIAMASIANIRKETPVR
jgi:hypothetical protein